CLENIEALPYPLRVDHRADRAFGATDDIHQAMKTNSLRTIPAVEKILQALGDTGMPRPVQVAVIRRELAALRAEQTIPEFDAILAHVLSARGRLRAKRIQPLINGTGIVIHTNLGRAPLGQAVIESVGAVAA